MGEQSRARGPAWWAGRRHDRALPKGTRKAKALSQEQVRLVQAAIEESARLEAAAAQGRSAVTDDPVIMPDLDDDEFDLDDLGEPVLDRRDEPADLVEPADQDGVSGSPVEQADPSGADVVTRVDAGQDPPVAELIPAVEPVEAAEPVPATAEKPVAEEEPAIAVEPESVMQPEPAAEPVPAAEPAENPVKAVLPEPAEPPAESVEGRPDVPAGPAEVVLAGQSARQDEVVPAEPSVPARQDRPGELVPAEPAGALSPAPSWGVVLGTTTRLWLERRGLRQASGARPSRSRARAIALLVLVIVVFAAGALTAALIWRHSSSAPGPERAAPEPGGGASAAAAARTAAARWVASEVSPGAIVGCDPVMCDALEAQHFPAGSLLTLNPSATDPLGSDVVVATAAVRSDFGSGLTSKYAPVALAAFGSGTARIEILVVAPDGVPAYRQALKADQEARRRTGAQLAGNPFLRPSPAARADLASGRIDSRLIAILGLLTAQPLAGQRGVSLLAFGAAPPGADPAVPLRTAELVPPPHAGASYLTDLRSLLRQQIAPYLASTISITRLQNGRTVLLVGFDAPGRLAQLGTQSRSAPPSAPAKASGKKEQKESPHKVKSSH